MSAQSAKPIPQLTPEQEQHFWSRLERMDNAPNCWEWTGSRKKKLLPYGLLTLNRLSLKAHRVAFAIVTGADVTGKMVAHRCDNPPCCNPTHLFLTDDEGNNHDRDAKDRWRPQTGPIIRTPSPGERNGNSKLTETQVREILAAPSGSMQMAADLGISYATLKRIRSRKLWKHVQAYV